MRPSKRSLPNSHFKSVCRLLRRGGVVAYPTEAVYGLGCDPHNGQAVARILELKQRPVDKGLILVAAEFCQFEALLETLPGARTAAALASWPGPYTWLWPALPTVPRWLRGHHDNIAVRVSAHPVVRELCLGFGGPLVSTSANQSGCPPARAATEVRAQFGNGVDFIVPGNVGSRSQPTEIRDLLTGAVLRGA